MDRPEVRFQLRDQVQLMRVQFLGLIFQAAEDGVSGGHLTVHRAILPAGNESRLNRRSLGLAFAGRLGVTRPEGHEIPPEGARTSSAASEGVRSGAG